MIPLRDNVRLVRAPFVTIALVLANVVAYVLATQQGWELFTGPSEGTGLRWGAIPYTYSHWGQHCTITTDYITRWTGLLCSGWPHVTGTVHGAIPAWETALSSMFLHANLLQLMWNMAFLVAVGCSIENRLGHVAFLVFYLLGGAAALALQVLLAPSSTLAVLGCSGGIAALFGAYMVLYPRGRFLTLLPFFSRVAFVEQPAWLMLAVFVVVTVLLGALGLMTPTGTAAGLAIAGQIGGVAFGTLIALVIPGRVKARVPGSELAT